MVAHFLPRSLAYHHPGDQMKRTFTSKWPQISLHRQKRLFPVSSANSSCKCSTALTFDPRCADPHGARPMGFCLWRQTDVIITIVVIVAVNSRCSTVGSSCRWITNITSTPWVAVFAVEVVAMLKREANDFLLHCHRGERLTKVLFSDISHNARQLHVSLHCQDRFRAPSWAAEDFQHVWVLLITS